MTHLADLTALELSARIEGGLRPSEVMAAFLQRIAARNPDLNAIVSLRPEDELMAEARKADAAPRKGWLHGIPLAVKDLAQTANLRTTFGSPTHARHVPRTDDLIVARMKAAGGIVIGKTNTSEWGLGSHTFNQVFGATANPYDHAVTPGGSSGGAAAALAARMLPVADGSDMMGSLRNPAAFCNVYGLRPTFGLVPNDPPGEMFLSTLATNGPMARNPSDLAALLDTIAGPDPRVPFGRSEKGFRAALAPRLSGLRIGWLADWGSAYPMEDGILAQCENALSEMEALGARIHVLAAPFAAPRLWDAWLTLRACLNAGARGALAADPILGPRLKPEAKWEVERGRTLSAAALHAASATRSEWFARIGGIFSGVDLIALPSAQVWPFDKTLRWPAQIAGREMDTYHRWMEVVIPVSLAGLPCISVPVGFGPSGLPMGMQLAGPVGADQRVLDAAEAWHQATDWPGRRPPPGC